MSRGPRGGATQAGLAGKLRPSCEGSLPQAIRPQINGHRVCTCASSGRARVAFKSQREDCGRDRVDLDRLYGLVEIGRLRKRKSMSNTRESKVSIRLDVILAPALKAFADPKYEQGQEFASRLLKYSNGFLNNLKIPASLSLSVKPRADDQRLIGSPFRIFLGGRRCR